MAEKKLSKTQQALVWNSNRMSTCINNLIKLAETMKSIGLDKVAETIEMEVSGIKFNMKRLGEDLGNET